MPKKCANFPAKRILELTGIVIDFTEISDDNNTITVHLKRDKRFKTSCCSECDSIAPRERRINRIFRDLPLIDKTVYLNCERYIVKCPQCKGYRREKLIFIDKCCKHTIRFETFIFELISMSTVSETANKYHLSWEAAKDIDKKYLGAQFSNIDYGDLKYISMDEIANKKGHDYLSIVMNHETGKVIWVGEGRKEEDIDKFYITLTEEQKDNIKAVSIDMWPAYINAAQKHCSNVDIVFDKFHVIKKFGEVLIKLRCAEYRKAVKAEDEKGQQILKGTKWLLLKNKLNLNEDKKKQLDQLLELNENLYKAYVLNEDLKHLWSCSSITEVKKAIANWITMADDSGIRGIKTFVKTLKKHEYGIINHCKHAVDNGKIEGTNNKIKTLKRRHYGFHDVEYFKLKILQTCQGKSKKI